MSAARVGQLSFRGAWARRLERVAGSDRTRLGSTLLGAAVLLAQPNPLLVLGVGLVLLPWAARLATGRGLLRTPLDVPLGLFTLSAGLGLLVTSDPVTAGIRWWGLVAALALTYELVPRVQSERACRAVLWLALGVGLVGVLAVLALTQGQVARGPLEDLLAPLLAPFSGLPRVLTAPVMETNTRFIINYNGLGDLGMLVVLAGLLLARHSRLFWQRGLALGLVGACGLLVVATGGRGSLLGLMGAVLVLGVAVRSGGVGEGGSGRGLDAGTRGRGDAGGNGARVRVLGLPPGLLALGLGLLALGLGLALSGVLDKGLQTDSLGGRVEFWRLLLATLGDYAFTGLGLGMQAPLNAIVYYGLTPRPDAMVYAHNMFLQTYLEQGPLGAVTLGLILAAAAACGVRALRRPLTPLRRAVLGLGLAAMAGFTIHGLTDQVPTSNFGTVLLLGAAALPVGVYTSLGRAIPASPEGVDPGFPRAQPRWLRPRVLVPLALAGALGLGLAISRPREPADVFASLGGLEAARAAAVDSANAEARRAHAASAERWLGLALAWSPEHPPALRHLAQLKLQQHDLATAAQALQAATRSEALSAFDMVQIGRLYYEMGFLEDGYRWTRAGYEASGGLYRDAAYQYDRLQLDNDWRVRTLVEQAEPLHQQRKYAEALPLWEQALELAPGNRYVSDRVEEARRAMQEAGRR